MYEGNNVSTAQAVSFARRVRALLGTSEKTTLFRVLTFHSGRVYVQFEPRGYVLSIVANAEHHARLTALLTDAVDALGATTTDLVGDEHIATFRIKGCSRDIRLSDVLGKLSQSIGLHTSSFGFRVLIPGDSSTLTIGADHGFSRSESFDGYLVV